MPKDFKCSPPTDKYSTSGLELLSCAITFEANLSPDGSPVNMNIFSQKETAIRDDLKRILIA